MEVVELIATTQTCWHQRHQRLSDYNVITLAEVSRMIEMLTSKRCQDTLLAEQKALIGPRPSLRGGPPGSFSAFRHFARVIAVYEPLDDLHVDFVGGDGDVPTSHNADRRHTGTTASGTSRWTWCTRRARQG